MSRPGVGTNLNGPGTRSIKGKFGGGRELGFLAASHAFPEGLSGGGLKGLVQEREIGEEVQEVFGGDVLAQTVFAARKHADVNFLARRAFRLPDSREVGLALATRRGGGQNGLAVFGSRGSGSGLIDPLGRCRQRRFQIV